MKCSYSENDVEVLLKDITGLVEPESTEIREKKIQSGVHYCEMLPIEYKPTDEYMKLYEESLEMYSERVAEAVGVLVNKIFKEHKRVVLVSLARAGIPVGILLKHYIKKYKKLDVRHYAISIIRGKGIDKNALNYILERNYPVDIVFVDGWTGKGAIQTQLREALKEYKHKYKSLLDDRIAVLADPAHVTTLYGTREDIIIPSSCLNSTVSGLISRTFLRDDIIGENDFHGAIYYKELTDVDRSYEFIHKIEDKFREISNIGEVKKYEGEVAEITGLDEVKSLMSEYNIHDINLIKPSIGETTRVLLRRVPDKVLINVFYKDTPDVKHIIQLCKDKNVSIEYKVLINYKAIGIIKELGDV